MSESAIDISLVVLASNDRPAVELFREMMEVWREKLTAIGRTYEVIVVDDGVGGPFVETVLDLRKSWPAIRLIQFRRTFGESVALDTAVEIARGRYVVTTTWYMQVEPEGLEKCIAILDEGTDFVACRRHPRIDGPGAQVVSWLFNAYTRWITKVKIYDLNCSFRAFRKEVVEELSYHGDLFRFISILAVQKGFRVLEIPLTHLREEGGRSTLLHPGVYIRRFLDILSLFFLIKFTRKPLRFFGLVGTGFLAVGLVICLWMAYVRLWLDKPLSDRPMLILGIFMVVLGIIVASIGLIGEIIIFTQGRNLRDYHIDRIVEGGADDDEEGDG
ncbi:MAG: hypothetical protein CMJ83_08135 [Planctomycetes bacterium]|nr:hypothetical protein [Planctomycetota bacterium]